MSVILSQITRNPLFVQQPAQLSTKNKACIIGPSLPESFAIPPTLTLKKTRGVWREMTGCQVIEEF